MKKLCRICLEEKDENEFTKIKGAKDGRFFCCKKCKAETNRNRYKLNSTSFKNSAGRWMRLNPEKVKAHTAVKRAINKGTLICPSFCSVCGSTEKLDAHHWHGYEKQSRLDVQWLCRKCHKIADSLVDL